MEKLKNIFNRMIRILLISLMVISSVSAFAAENFPTTVKRNPGNTCQVQVIIQILLWNADSTECANMRAGMNQKFSNLNCTIPCVRPPSCAVSVSIVVEREANVTDTNERKKYHWIVMVNNDGNPSNAVIGAPNQPRADNFRNGTWRKGRTIEEYAHETLHLGGLQDEYCDRRNVTFQVVMSTTSITRVVRNCNPGPDPQGGNCCTPPANGRCTAPCPGHEKDIMGTLSHLQDPGQPPGSGNSVVPSSVSCDNVLAMVTAGGQNSCPEIPCCPAVITHCPGDKIDLPPVITRPATTGCTYTPTSGEFDPTALYDKCPLLLLANDYNGLSSLDGAVFPVGLTTVIWTYMDQCGYVEQCSVDIIITEGIPPVVVCPPDIIVPTDTGVCYYTGLSDQVDLPFYEDNCGILGVSNSYNGDSTLAGAIFPAGTTTVTWTVGDLSNNTALCILNITVQDVEPPVLICPPDVTIDYADSTFDPGSDPFDGIIDDNCGTTSLAPTYPPEFPVGVTPVMWTATDPGGNVSTCIQNVVRLGPCGITIEQSELPVFCQGALLTLGVKSSNYMDSTMYYYVSYLWSTGETGAEINVGESAYYSVTVTTDDGCVAAASQYVTVDPAAMLSAYTLVGNMSVKLAGVRVYEGGVGVMKPAKGTMDAKKQTYIVDPGTFVKSPQIVVDHSSIVDQKYYAPAALTLPAFEIMPWHGGANIAVPNNQTMIFDDTLYRDIKVGKNATVIFTKPVVNIGMNLKIEDGAALVFTQCTRVRLAGKLQAKKNVTINPDEVPVVFYAGSDVMFGEGCQFTGALYLSDGDGADFSLKISASKSIKPGIYKGLFIAKTIDAGQNTRFYFNPACGDCIPVTPKECIPEPQIEVVAQDVLLKCYPNPFNNTTTILFRLPDDMHARLDVYDLSGKCVGKLFDGNANANTEYRVEFRAGDLPAGIYIYRFSTVQSVLTGKMMLIRE